MKKKTDKWTKVLRVLFMVGVGIFVAMVIGIPIAISMQEVEDPVKHADTEEIIITDTLTTTDSVKDYKDYRLR